MENLVSVLVLQQGKLIKESWFITIEESNEFEKKYSEINYQGNTIPKKWISFIYKYGK